MALPVNLMGFQIIESPYIPEAKPKIQIDPNFPWITEKGRGRINSWLLEMFGSEAVIYIIGGNFAVDPKTAAMIRSATK